MLTQRALLVGADVTRLYRRLSAAGATFPRMRLRLDEDSYATARMGFRLIKNAAPQVLPGVRVAYGGRNSANFYIASSILSQTWDADRREISLRISQSLNGYRRYPLRASFSWLWTERCLALQVFAWDSMDESWYVSRSFCGFWDRMCEIATLIRQIEAERQQRRAGSAAGTQP